MLLIWFILLKELRWPTSQRSTGIPLDNYYESKLVSRIIVYPLIPHEDHVGVVTEAEA